MGVPTPGRKHRKKENMSGKKQLAFVTRPHIMEIPVIVHTFL